MKNVTTKQLEEMFTKYKSKLWSHKEVEQMTVDLIGDGYLVYEEFSPIVNKHIIHITKDLKVDLA